MIEGLVIFGTLGALLVVAKVLIALDEREERRWQRRLQREREGYADADELFEPFYRYMRWRDIMDARDEGP